MVSGYVQRRARGCTPAEKSGTLRARFAGGALAQKVTLRAVCRISLAEKAHDAERQRSLSLL